MVSSMERLLLPIGNTREDLPGFTILQWHVEEGVVLTKNLPLLTIQTGTQTLQCYFRSKGHGLVLKKRVALAGEHLASYATLALIGKPDESVPDVQDIQTLPLFGTSAAMKRTRKYYLVLVITLLCTLFLIVLNGGVDAGLHFANVPKPGVLLMLREVLNVISPIAFGCLFAPLVCLVCFFLMLQTPAEPKSGLGLRRLPALSG